MPTAMSIPAKSEVRARQTARLRAPASGKMNQVSNLLQAGGIKYVETNIYKYFTRPFVGVVSGFVGTGPRHRAGLAGKGHNGVLGSQ